MISHGLRCSAIVLAAQVLCLGARAEEVPPVADQRSGSASLAGGSQPGSVPLASHRASQIGLRLELDPALEVSGNEYFSSQVSSAVGFGVDWLFELGGSWFGPGSHWFGVGARYERAWTGDPLLKDAATGFFVPLLAGVAVPVGGDWLLEARIGLGPTAVVFDHFNVIQTALGGAVEVSLAFGFQITHRTTLLFGPDGRLSLLALPENGSSRKLGATSLLGLHVDVRRTF